MAKGNDLKRENIKSVRRCFYYGDVCSINDVETRTGLSHGSTINAIRALLANQEIILCDKSGTSVGRKTNLYSINREYHHFLLIDVRRTPDGFTIRMRRMNMAAEISDTCEKFIQKRPRNYLQKEIKMMMDRWPDTDMILISTPGVCKNGIVSFEGKTVYDIGSFISENYHIPCVIENDVNVASIGLYNEYHVDNLAVVYQAGDTIFGCGIVIHGRLYNGYSHAAGELRYIPFSKRSNKPDPLDLFQEEILTVTAVINPELVGYFTELSDQPLDFTSSDIPLQHTPKYCHITDFDKYILKGLYSIGIYNLIEQTGGLNT